MLHLYDFIVEALLNESKDENKNDLKEAAKKIFKLLQKKEKLEDYVDELNKILSGNAEGEDNTELWLKALIGVFSGQGDASKDVYNKFTCKGGISIKCTELYPTQNEIDIENSAKWITKDWGAKGVADMFSGKPFGKDFPVPVLIYNDGSKNWIIDGHHRWSQVSLINRDAELYCMVIEGKVEPQEFLKLTQSVIASVAANKGQEKLPVGKANPDNNIFGNALAGDKLKEKIIAMAEDASNDIIDILYKTLNKNKVVDKNGKLIIKESNENNFKESLGTLVMNNRDAMVKDGQKPEKWCSPRPVMPQSDQAGAKSNNDSKVTDDGSALNKLAKVKALPDV